MVGVARFELTNAGVKGLDKGLESLINKGIARCDTKFDATLKSFFFSLKRSVNSGFFNFIFIKSKN